MKDVHNGLGETSDAKAMASHRGINTTYDKVSSRFLWYSMRSDIIDFINRCDLCQKQGDLTMKIKTELQNVPVPTAVMKQIGIDQCNLPEVDGYYSLVVCSDYFSKWSEAEPIKREDSANDCSIYIRSHVSPWMLLRTDQR